MRRKPIGPNGENVFSASIVFRSALFRSDVVVFPTGELRLEGETVLVENLPIEFADQAEVEGRYGS